ncbi:MAG: response regulator [Candidatus Neomarinimicrobiota bacterium]
MIFEHTFVNSPTALVVEDNEEHIKYLQFLLKKLEINVVGYTSWREALKNARNYDIDFALLDINLGEGMNGITLMELLKQNQNLKEADFISVTAYYSQDYLDDFLAAGFVDYIAKPYSIKELEEVIHKPRVLA